ncbi:MAG TPA: hypothetical protein VL916_05515 [Ilumatobacteraceae bacterium]|nr:hypothetical protein [Ilumatobacteraceae bacterium]
MSDTVVNETTNALLLDGDAPRLGTSSAPMLPNVPPPSSFANVDSGPTLPLVSQVLTDGSAPTLPTLPVAAPTPVVHTTESTGDADSGEPRHPMAHLMPEKIKPSEASIRAAEARALKKKKAKKVKIIVSICVVVVTAVVGPPLVKWTINAVNEAGSTKQDEPTEQPADTGSDPQATPAAGQQAIDDAKALTSATTTPAAP